MKINKSYILAGAAALTSAIILPYASVSQVEAASQTYMTTTAVNFRTGPSTNYSIITTIAQGKTLEVSEINGGWAKGTYNGKSGYISASYIKASSTSTATATTYYVNTTVGLNVRSGPGTGYSKLGLLSYKTNVVVLSTSNGWSQINYNGKTGYVSSVYLTKGQATTDSSSSSSTSTSTTVKYVNTTAGLNVRSGAGTSYSKLGLLSYGSKVEVISTSNGWSKINYNGKTGYVSDQYLQSTAPTSTGSSSSTSTSASVSKVISYAKTLLGKPYVWGAQGPNSFDCSGFTYYVFKNAAGKIIPRVSSAQSTYGTYVSKSNLQAGDLVFFDTSGVNNGAVSHVGMYIGNGQMIHASSSKGQIVIVDFNSSYYQRTYVNARRVL